MLYKQFIIVLNRVESISDKHIKYLNNKFYNTA